MKEYLNCTKCGLCLSDCPSFQEDNDEKVNPRGVMLLMKENPRYLESVRKKCRSKCGEECRAMNRCPMNININQFLRG